MTKHFTFAIIYDFDGTLSPQNMQEYSFIPKLQIEAQEFWEKSQKLEKENFCDPTLAYMYTTLNEAKKHDIAIRKQNFIDCGKEINFFPGVEEWFNRINAYSRELGINIEHYIISSGLIEMIQGSGIAQNFKKIFASAFMYDVNGLACWPARAINYTTKTQYLFRINKGTLDESDNRLINTYIPDNERPIPFTNMLYIGDGLTDIPCFRLMKNLGGYSIAVFNKTKNETIKRIALDGDRVSMIFNADYRTNSKLDNAVKIILRKVQLEHELGLIKKQVKADFEK